MRKLHVAVLIGVLFAGLGFAYPVVDGNKDEVKKDKASIEDVMKTAMKGGLNRKVVTGEATDDEKLQFLSLMIDLVENDPPKGDHAEWKSMAGAVVLNAAKVVVGREGAGDLLKEAINCKACHDKFKPE